MMNIIQIFILSITTFFLFKFISPIIIGLLRKTLGLVGNITLVNALLFGLIFVIIFRINEMYGVLKAFGLK